GQKAKDTFPGTASRMTGSDEDGDSGWDAWGTWSDCSRTCGGGASYSLRRCLNGGNCEGKNIRYRTCSNMDCPVESGDFRAQQCSAHNDIRYQGMVYEWIPVPYEPSAACALRCQARGRSLTVELAPKVLDGTRCRADALDMCISGVCQEVGCDRQLGSGAREDNCGVCAGAGSTCRLVRGQSKLNLLCPTAVKTVLEVPLGSRSLRVSSKGPDVIVIETQSLQGRKEEHSLVSPGSYLIGNTTVDYQKGTDRQTFRTQGPLGADYIIKVKYAAPRDTMVQFLFYQPIRYQWRETDFFPCSVTCGGGYQLNSAECTDIRSSQVLPEHHCNSYPENTKPTPKLKECNMDLCPERWEQGPWTECSVSCGESGGLQERSVVCVEDDAHGHITQVEEWKCTHSPRPITQQSCNSFTCPQWVAMEWSQCTVTCGRGLRYRVVLCIDHRGQHTGGCNTSLKPHIKEDCLVPVACHKPRESVPVEAKLPWLKQAQELEEERTATEEPTLIPGPWSPCSVTCGLGKQTRELKCRVLLSFTQTEVDLPEEECGEERPQLERPCDGGACTLGPGFSPDLQDPQGPHTQGEEPHHWDYRGFSGCSASCATGRQTAVVRCVSRRRGGEEFDDSHCDPSSRPPVIGRICNPEPCPPRWEVTAWTRCSASCGVGIQTRSVFCMRVLSVEQQDSVSVSEKECREFKPSILQPCNQVHCPPAWETEPWQECSLSCGGGSQVRTVFCKQLLSTGAYWTLGDTACPGAKPAPHRTCSKTDCLPYMAGGEWGKCSVSCGLGIQRREPVCRRLTSAGQQVMLARRLCNGLSSPPLVRTCRMITCPGEYTHTHTHTHRIYIQTRQEKRLHLTVGGRAYLLPKTSLIIKCPVRRFQKAYIRWEKDGRPLPSCKRLGVTKSGSLKIHSLGVVDSGVYVCIAGPASDTFTLKLIGSDSRLIDRPVENKSDPEPGLDLTRIQPRFNPQDWDPQGLPHCLPFTPSLKGTSLSLLPSVSLSSGRSSMLDILCFCVFKVKYSVICGMSELVILSLVSYTSALCLSVCLSASLCHSLSLSLSLYLFSLPLLSPLSLPGVPQPTVTWQRKEGVLDVSVAVPLPSGSLWLQNVTLQSQGTYSCVAANPIGKSTASTVLHVTGGFTHTCERAYTHTRACVLYTQIYTQVLWQPPPARARTHTHKFAWRLGDWTACSASCGDRGTRTRRVRCVTPEGREVTPSMCHHLDRPVSSQLACNLHDCPPSWVASVWSKCSTSCGRGWRQRQVSCGQVESGGAVRTLPPSVCGRNTRPADRQECTCDNCPAWVTSPWGKCSGKCLGPTLTVQKRSVICRHFNGTTHPDCDPRERPVSVRNCSSELCDVHWRVGPWRACTAACGSGFQSRRVDCAHRRSGRTLADQHCTWHRRPATWQHCNATTCGSECKDTTHYCAVVKRLKLCPIDMYKQRCCESCLQEDGST
uniref:ADAMTS like 3 n=1 Tax=Salmo trutta TaxID=8032 RepID=A0A674EQY4_SALTR